jgi:hypothetical protein
VLAPDAVPVTVDFCVTVRLPDCDGVCVRVPERDCVCDAVGVVESVCDGVWVGVRDGVIPRDNVRVRVRV